MRLWRQERALARAARRWGIAGMVIGGRLIAAISRAGVPCPESWRHFIPPGKELV